MFAELIKQNVRDLNKLKRVKGSEMTTQVIQKQIDNALKWRKFAARKELSTTERKHYYERAINHTSFIAELIIDGMKQSV